MSKLHPFIVQIDPGWVSSARWLIANLANLTTLDDISAHVDLVVDGRTLNDDAPPEPILPMLSGLSTAWSSGGAFRFQNAPITIAFPREPGRPRCAHIRVADAPPVVTDELSSDWFERTFSAAVERAVELGVWPGKEHEPEPRHAELRSPPSAETSSEAGCIPAGVVDGTHRFESPEVTPLFSFAAALRWRSALRTPLELNAGRTIQAHVTGGDRLWIGYPAAHLEGAARSALADVRGDADGRSLSETPEPSFFQVSVDTLVGSIRAESGQHCLVGIRERAESVRVTVGASLTPFFWRGGAANAISTDADGRARLHVLAQSGRNWRTFDLSGWTGGAVQRAAWAGDTLLVTAESCTQAFSYDGHTFHSRWRSPQGYPALVTQYLVPGYLAVVDEHEMVILSSLTGAVQSRIQRFWWHFEFGAIDRRGALHLIETSESGRRDYLRLPPDGLLALVA